MYGGLGLAIDGPQTELVVSKAKTFEASGAEHARAAKLAASLASALGLSGAYHVEVLGAIPAHAGLGSGTQLALAIGTGLIRLEGLAVPPRRLGELVERGARSAIGMAAFQHGGFVVDGGRGKDQRAPPVVAHLPFPEAWRILLILDRQATGVHGERETAAFAALPPFAETKSAHLCRLVLMQLLPGLAEHDIVAFGTALTEIQQIVGGHFAAAQGGSPWSSPRVGALAESMSRAGAVGIGQSSWGPSGFACVDSAAAAARLYSTFVGEATARGLEILIVSGRNHGATVEPLERPRQND